MPIESLELSILKDNSIHNLEKYLSQLYNDEIKKVTLKLPRKHRNTFFKESWISSLITTASCGRELTITDWNDHSSQEEFTKRFSNSLIGITSAFVASEINDTSRRRFEFHIKDIVDKIVFEKDGLIEDHEAGKSFVFCSFDSPKENLNFPKPLALSASSKEEFIRKFLEIKRSRIDHAGDYGSSYQLTLTHDSDIELANLVFELYENTHQHGKYDQRNNLIEGVRSFTIKRHSSHDTGDLLERAKPFKELEDYITALHHKRNLHFYEITISDNGIGIINRFRAARPELYHEHKMDALSDSEKLNRIIHRNLSSKLYPGSGLGLTLAFKNLQSRKGFVSLRTADQWVYFDGARSNINKENPFQSVRYKNELSCVAGTHYSILIPVF